MPLVHGVFSGCHIARATFQAVFDPEARNHVKGMRGNFDLDELGELVRTLQAIHFFLAP